MLAWYKGMNIREWHSVKDVWLKQRDEHETMNLGKVLAQAWEWQWKHCLLREDRFRPKHGHEKSKCIAWKIENFCYNLVSPSTRKIKHEQAMYHIILYEWLSRMRLGLQKIKTSVLLFWTLIQKVDVLVDISKTFQNPVVNFMLSTATLNFLSLPYPLHWL